MSDSTAPAWAWWNTKIAVAAGIAVAAAIFTVLAFQLPLYSRSGQPGSGLFPQMLGTGWLILSLVNLIADIVTERRKHAAADDGEAEAVEPATVLWMVLLTTAYVAAFQPLGAILASALYGMACVFLLKKEDRTTALVAVALTPIALVILIQVLLKQNLPVGLLSFLPFL